MDVFPVALRAYLLYILFAHKAQVKCRIRYMALLDASEHLHHLSGTLVFTSMVGQWAL